MDKLFESSKEQLWQGEMVSLNAAELDVEELESRLEMASAVPNDDCWANACGINLA